MSDQSNFLDHLTVVKRYIFLYLIRALRGLLSNHQITKHYPSNDVNQPLGIFTNWRTFTSTRHYQVAYKIFALDADADAGLVSANSAISHHS